MKISFKGGKIHYSDMGKGSVIVLIHGYLETMEVWEHFAEQVAKNYRVVTIDLPGHGQSDYTGETNTMELLAEAIKEVLDFLSIKKAFLVGHSMGGYVTLAFLELFPEYLSGYCLFHSHPLADAPETIEKRINDISVVMAGKKDFLIPESIKKMYADANIDKLRSEIQRANEIASKIPGAVITAVLSGMMARPSRVDIVEAGRVPFLWILGELDHYINCEIIRQKVKLPINTEVMILKKSGHMGFIEEEDLSLEVIIQFARKLL